MNLNLISFKEMSENKPHLPDYYIFIVQLCQTTDTVCSCKNNVKKTSSAAPPGGYMTTRKKTFIISRVSQGGDSDMLDSTLTVRLRCIFYSCDCGKTNHDLAITLLLNL